MNRRRLLKLATFLDTIPLKKFNFDIIASVGEKPMMEALKAGNRKCGTVGCAIGWLPAAFPRSFKWDDPGTVYPHVRLTRDGIVADFEAAALFFGISRDDASWLFVPNNWSDRYERHNGLAGSASPRAVAAHIRKFVKGEYRQAR